MAKVEGCWANVLDDCEGPLTGEHLVSVAVWNAMDGRPNNRAGRVDRMITLRGSHHIPDGEYRLDDLKANILCRGHNRGTSRLDEEGKVFSQAIDSWRAMVGVRRRQRFVTKWPMKSYLVSGPLLERLLLKLAVNNAYKGTRPIGGPNAAPGEPTRELVEMIFGRRPVVRPAGLFILAKVGTDLALGAEQFAPMWLDDGQCIAGCVWSYRTLTVGVQFVPDARPDLHTFHPATIDLERLPFQAFDAGRLFLSGKQDPKGRLNTEVRLVWP